MDKNKQVTREDDSDEDESFHHKPQILEENFEEVEDDDIEHHHIPNSTFVKPESRRGSQIKINVVQDKNKDENRIK
jgi:hypothetical protein